MYNDTFEIENCKIMCSNKEETSFLVQSSFFVRDPTYQTWIPEYAIHDDSPIWQVGEEGTLIVKSNFAIDRGWL